MKAMRNLLVVLLVVAGAAGCDSTRRDFGQCDQTYSECLKGFTCDLTQGLCVPDNGQTLPEAAPESVDAAAVDVATVPDAADAPTLDAAQGDAPPAMDAAVDGSVDIAQPVDVATPDLRVPDAQGSCSVDNDCVGGANGLAYCVAAKCVACKTNGQCDNDAGVPFCSAQNSCVACTSTVVDGGAGCPAAAPQCDPSSGRCFQCIQNSDCPTAGKGFCVGNQCVGCDSVPAGYVTSDAGAAADGASTDGGAAATGPCTGATPVCATAGNIAGQCVGCASNTDCGGSTPICGTANTCTACTSDTQCAAIPGGPGVCMFHQNGRCASDAETIYVENSVGCIGGGGTSASPYCQAQAGINAITATKRVVVMIGPTMLDVWSASPTGTQISVIGQSGATVSPGVAAIGIHVVRGDVYIRGMSVQGSGTSALNAGIVVDSGATIRLDGCIVMKNAGGLLVRDGAGFDIANSVFAQNQSGAVAGTASVFGGVFLGTAGAGLPSRFWFNTIADNQQFGAVCTSSTQVLNAVLLWDDAGGEVANCTVASTTKSPNRAPSGIGGVGFVSDSTDPKFDTTKPYHLTASSPCVGFVPSATLHPADDIDSDPRPKVAGGRLDCGADEF
jgi:hypothetical protein